MAPDAPTKKRKRGRPRLGQNNKQLADASGSQHMARRDRDDSGDGEGAEERPGKRGKAKEENAVSPSAMDVQTRKRGREVARQQHQQPQNEAQPEPSRKGRKRQRETQAQQQDPEEQPHDTEPETVSEAPRKNRRREDEQQARRRKFTDKQPATEPEAADEAPRRKRGQNRRQDIGLDQDTPQAKVPAPAPRGKRGRPPAQEHHENEVERREAEEEPNPGPRNRVRPSRRGLSPSPAKRNAVERRKKGNRPSQTQEMSGQDEGTQNKSRSRGYATAAEPSKRRSTGFRPESPVVQTRDPKRRRSRQQSDQDGAALDSSFGPPPSPPKPYVHIVPQVRRVRQSTITAKWSPLAGPSLSTVSALLHLAHQPILQRLSGTHQRREHASAALCLMARRISRKLAASGLPFPPASMPAAPRSRGGQQQQQQQSSDGGRETELDFESVLDAKAALEAQLEPTAHAVELLRREKDGVERELERDYETLRQLETRARSQAREQRGLLKKAHALTPLAMMPEQPQNARAAASVLAPATTSSDNLFTGLATAADDDDVELRQLAVQLGGHVESMSVNLRQADGLAAQLARARAALRATLLTHLDPDQYERVVLG